MFVLYISPNRSRGFFAMQQNAFDYVCYKPSFRYMDFASCDTVIFTICIHFVLSCAGLTAFEKHKVLIECIYVMS